MIIAEDLYNSIINAVITSGKPFGCNFRTEEEVTNLMYAIKRITRNSIEGQYVEIRTEGTALYIEPRQHTPSDQLLYDAFQEFLKSTEDTK